MVKQPDWPGTTDEMEARRRRVRRVAKAFGAYNYTPLWAKRLAEIFVELSEDTNERRYGMRGLITRVLEGKSK